MKDMHKAKHVADMNMKDGGEVNHEHGNQPIHQDADYFVKAVKFEKGGCTTNEGGTGDAHE